MNGPARKRRTREHVIADLSVNHVERHALLGGHVIERFTNDYGIDLELFTFNREGEIEEGSILLQLKATDRLRLRPNLKDFSFRIDRRDLVLWLAQPMPVILIVYDARGDIAYWLYVQSHFRNRKGFNLFTAGKTVTVKLPFGNVVDARAIQDFVRYRDQILEQTRKGIHHDKE